MSASRPHILLGMLAAAILAGPRPSEGSITEYRRNATGWREAQPRYVGYALDQSAPSQGSAFTGCNIVSAPDPTAPRVLQLVGGQVTITSRDAAEVNICPIQDSTSLALASDGLLPGGGSFVLEFDPPISAFYANYGSLAIGETCTMALYADGAFVDTTTSSASTDNGLAAGHGFVSTQLIDEVRITCTEPGPVLIGAFRGLLGNLDDLGEVCVPAYDSDCSGPNHTPVDFACVFEGDEITIALGGVAGAPDEFIAVPRGRSVYALLVSGYAQNEDLNLLHYFDFANFILKQGGYVHYAWWNNLLAPYMRRPLHDPQSYPGNLNTQIGGFVPVPGPDGFFNDKARPEEDTQFQADARQFLAAIKSVEPHALLVVVGHSMGGGAVARLGSDTDTEIDLLAPIDPVGNRSIPLGRIGQSDYNWTRWRAIRNEFLGFKDQDCERLLTFCTLPLDCAPLGNWRTSPPGLLGGWGLTSVQCGVLVHNPSRRDLPMVRNLYHKWQNEAVFPFDFGTNIYFNFSPPAGGRSIQQPVDTCASGADPVDQGINCTSNDGHGEIVGFRHVPPNMILDGLAATAWSANAATRESYLKQWETQGDAWGHRPVTPELCMVSSGLISMLQGMLTFDDASLVTEHERSAVTWKQAVPGRWESFAFDEFAPSTGSAYTGCTITGGPDPTLPRTLQLTGGQVTVSARDSTGTPVCPLNDSTSAAPSTDLIIPPAGRAVMEFSPPIGAFYANFGSLEEARNVRLDLYAGDQLVDYVISAASPPSANSVQAIGEGFVSPTLIDRVEFTSTEAGVVLVGSFRGVLSASESLGTVCIPAYSPACTTLTERDFACVFGPGPIRNQTRPGAPFYYTVGAAIDAAEAGDEIQCDPGQYHEAVNFGGKAIRLRASGAATLDASGLVAVGSVVTCTNGEGPDTILEGFTLTGGIGTLIGGERLGGGLYISGSSPTVVNCRLIDNHAARGGGAYSSSGSPAFFNCTIIHNTAAWGAGLHASSGAAALTNCLIAVNVASAGGGGVLVQGGGHPSLVNCTLADNAVLDGFGGGVFLGAESALSVVNSILWHNASASTSMAARQIHVEPDAVAAVTFSNIGDDDPGAGTAPFGGAAGGNVDLDPRFVDHPQEDYRLKPTSPCIDAGHDEDVPADHADLDADADVQEPVPWDLGGGARFFDADEGGAARVDMGAHEFSGCRGDQDGDGQVDLADHAALVACMEAAQPATQACLDVLDFNSNFAIDLFDFCVLQRNLGCAP